MSWTIQKLLTWTTRHFTEKGLESPRLSAEILLAEVLDLARIELYTNFDRPVAPNLLERLRAMVKRASAGEPVAYIVGRTEFYSLSMAVGPSCVIPRPETELLVERAIEFLRDRGGPQLVCDLCTGSGCVAVAIAKNVAAARVIATDICDGALAAAARNTARHGISDRVNLLKGDLFEPVLPRLDTEKFDLVVANPPYVSSGRFETLEPVVRKHEPRPGLDGGEDGLDVIRRIVADSPAFLKEAAALMLEIGHGHGQAVRRLMETSGPFERVEIHKDFAGIDRVVVAVKKKAPSAVTGDK
jgi:release factor glutamine methyltransferase